MKPANALLILLMTLLCGLSACSREATDAVDTAAPADTALDRSHDHFTLANYEAFTTRHLALDLDVDFEARTLSGLATLHMQPLDKAAREIILDTRSLHIQGAWMGNGDDRQPAEFSLGETVGEFGEALTIQLPERFMPEDEFVVELRYRTDPGSTALQWLPPDLTSADGT